MKCLLKFFTIVLFLFLLNYSLLAQEKSSISPCLSLRFGQSQTMSASSFFNVYNNPYTFLRPFYLTAQRWKSFVPFKNKKTWAFDLSIKMGNSYSVGISLGYQEFTAHDKQIYPGIIGYDDNNDPVYFNIDEKHIFRTKFMPIIAFVDYPIFKNSFVCPVVGLGVGIGNTELMWDWELHSNGSYNGSSFTIDYERRWINLKEKKFIFQPRFRVALNLIKISENIGKYIDNLHVQFDYIYCKGNYDLFKKFRKEFLPGEQKETVTENKKKVFDKYDVKWGGVQLMVGISIHPF